MSWWVALLSFTGGVLGSGLAAWVALRGQHQDARGEWRLRLDRALELIGSASGVQQQIGDELLADLIESDLGSEKDRDLARRIARVRLAAQLGEVGSPGVEVDLAALAGDNDGKSREERR